MESGAEPPKFPMHAFTRDECGGFAIENPMHTADDRPVPGCSLLLLLDRRSHEVGTYSSNCAVSWSEGPKLYLTLRYAFRPSYLCRGICSCF